MIPFPRRHKYSAHPSRDEEGRYWASAAERSYYDELKLREFAGDVRNLELQPKIVLVAGIAYRPDFTFEAKGLGKDRWRRIYVDVKGAETEAFRLKCRLWREFGPGPLQIVKRRGKRAAFQVVREILPKPSAGDRAGAY